jgi:hypothetical protein
MSTFPGSPKLVRGGIVLLDPVSWQQKQVIPLQYNPDQLTRTLAPQSDSDSGDTQHTDALRLKGPAVETIKLDAEIDATDELELPDQNRNATELGIGPALSVLELLVYPPTSELRQRDRLVDSGQLEITPAEGPLVVLVWGKQRVIPVKITEFSIVEDAFDANLNPIRAKVSLTMKVLTVTDLGFSHKGGSLYLAYQQAKEQSVRKARQATITELGIPRVQ